ncbi:hypothetical protein LPJ61_004697 [Coemansia biformis]|uniref:Uncharacterized protein n=1 Tax=Coemansia biformis TaxID=1286918 RepID=A0A9W7Y902_9FUNG|nr:hypothetical protein LPJ61_004697 [Coemansia biformis]
MHHHISISNNHNMKLSFARIVAVVGGASVVLGNIYIPGIVSVDLDSKEGLRLSVLGGLITANIGSKRPREGQANGGASGAASGAANGGHSAEPSAPPKAF